MEPKELKELWDKQDAELKKVLAKAEEEVKNLGKMSLETKNAVNDLTAKAAETGARLLAIEQKLVAGNAGGVEPPKSIGETFIESEGFKGLKGGAGRSGQVKIGSFWKTNIVNATGQNQPLVPDMRTPGIISPGLRRLTVRDLLAQGRTQSNLVQFARELLLTSAAASQTAEGTAKAESALTFELANAPVQTIAHWIPASRQILDDAPMLQDYINSRLMYGLKLEEERQLLSGNGLTNNLSGLIANSTTFSTTNVNTTTDTFIDVLRRAITQVQDSYFEPDGFVLNPHDWETIQLTKTTGTASSGEYIFSNPHVVEDNKIWGLPVVPTLAMTQGQFLCGAFKMAAQVWDRQDATIEVSREHASFFTQNLVAILCEERLALTVYRPLALIYGGFPFGS